MVIFQTYNLNIILFVINCYKFEIKKAASCFYFFWRIIVIPNKYNLPYYV